MPKLASAKKTEVAKADISDRFGVYVRGIKVIKAFKCARIFKLDTLMLSLEGMNKVLVSKDVYKWSSPHCDESGAEPFDSGYGVTGTASRGQVVAARDGAVLEAASANCLVVTVFITEARIGLLIHIGRDYKLALEDAELIRKPLNGYLRHVASADIAFVSSPPLLKQYRQQIQDLEVLFQEWCPAVKFENILVVANPNFSDECEDDPMCADVFLNIGTGELTVSDDFGPTQTRQYC